MYAIRSYYAESQKWDGVIRGVFTSTSQKIWDKLSYKMQKKYLTNVWCPECKKNTTITSFQGAIDIDGA